MDKATVYTWEQNALHDWLICRVREGKEALVAFVMPSPWAEGFTAVVCDNVANTGDALRRGSEATLYESKEEAMKAAETYFESH